MDPTDGGIARVGEPCGEAGRAWGTGLGRLTEGALGRTLLDPLEGLGAADGRELEPREPWLEGREADDPRDGEADEPLEDEPLEGEAELPFDPR